MIRFGKTFLVVGALVAAGTTRAQAALVPVLTSPTAGGTASTFVYALDFGTNAGTESLVTGNSVTIAGFDSGITAANVVVTPSSPGPLTPSVSGGNLTFTYTGTPTITTNTAWTATITLSGSFTTRLSTYSGVDEGPLGPQPFGPSPVLVPSAVPEPTSLVLGAFALPLLVFLRRRRAT